LVLDPVDRRLETGISLCRAEHLDVAPDAAALSFAELPDHKTDWLFAEMPTATGQEYPPLINLLRDFRQIV
jgi:hypothetical protein